MLSRAWLSPPLGCHSCRSSVFPPLLASSSESTLTGRQSGLAPWALCYLAERSELGRTSAVANHLAISLSPSCFSPWPYCELRIRQHREMGPAICTESNAMKPFHQAASQHRLEGTGVIPSQRMSLALRGRTRMLYFCHVLTVESNARQ